MDLKEFTREDIPRVIAQWLRFKASTTYGCTIECLANGIEDGAWMLDLEEQWKLDSYMQPHSNC